MTLRQYASFSMVMVLLTVVSYFWLDRAIATYVYQSGLSSLHWPNYIVDIEAVVIYGSAGLGILGLIMWAVQGRYTVFSKRAITFAVGLVVVRSVKDFFKFVFARYWPSTWVDNDPSWINTHDYGFHWFHSGMWYASFPSGHSAVMFYAATMFCIWLPKWRPLWLAIALAVVLGLITLNYHFLGDCFAGIYVGTSLGLLTLKLPINSLR